MTQELGSLPIIKPLQGSPEEENAYFLAVMSPEFQNAQTFTQQIGILCQHLRNSMIRVSFERIGSIFNKTRQCVEYHNDQYYKDSKPNGRPPDLTEEQLMQVQNEIIRLLTNPDGPIYPTYEEISDFIYFSFDIIIDPSTLRHYLHEKFNGLFKTATGIPLEYQRLFLNIKNLEENLKELKNKIDGVPTRFVFNLDECGVQEYADSEKSCYRSGRIYPQNCSIYN